jgi:Trk-type K+ transport system membrane component
MAMLWDILAGVLGAILLLVVFSLMLTGLSHFYQDLFNRHLRRRISRPDLIPVFSRFAAVTTLAIFLGLALIARIGD